MSRANYALASADLYSKPMQSIKRKDENTFFEAARKSSTNVIRLNKPCFGVTRMLTIVIMLIATWN